MGEISKYKPTNQQSTFLVVEKPWCQPDIVAHAHSPELGGLRRGIGLYSKTLPQKTKQKQWEREREKSSLACSRECLLVLPYLRYKSVRPPFVNKVLLEHSYIL